MSETTCTFCDHAHDSLRKFRCGKDARTRVVTGYVANDSRPGWCPLDRLTALEREVKDVAMGAYHGAVPLPQSLMEACAALDAAQKGKP